MGEEEEPRPASLVEVFHIITYHSRTFRWLRQGISVKIEILYLLMLCGPAGMSKRK